MINKTLIKIIAMVLIAALTALVSALESSCTTLVVSQKNPKDSTQKIDIETSVDSTKLFVQPALNFGK